MPTRQRDAAENAKRCRRKRHYVSEKREPYLSSKLNWSVFINSMLLLLVF